MNLSFFTRNGVTITRGCRGSSIIRGKQVAEYLGAKLNPKDNFENDICIYVKVLPKSYPKNSYLDIIDGRSCISWLDKHPDIGIIACTEFGQKFLSDRLKRDDIILIPQHHCNYNRVVRDRKEIKTVGVIGRIDSMFEPILEVKKRLKELGIVYFMKYRYTGKEDVVKFYKSIDIQVIGKRKQQSKNSLKNSLKIINACSFGIPTIAFPEIGYKDMEDYYIPINNLDDMIREVKRLKKVGWNPERLIKKSEEYNIDNIAKLYNNL